MTPAPITRAMREAAEKAHKGLEQLMILRALFRSHLCGTSWLTSRLFKSPAGLTTPIALARQRHRPSRRAG